MKKVLKNNGKSLKLTTLGFTLIELLAVIIILAIIALIAVPIILDVVEDARISAGKSEAQMILSGINNYCTTEDVKYQMDNNYVRKCTTSLDVEKVKEMINLGNATVDSIKYDGSRLTELIITSNNHTFTLCASGQFAMDEECKDPRDELIINITKSEGTNLWNSDVVLDIKQKDATEFTLEQKREIFANIFDFNSYEEMINTLSVMQVTWEELLESANISSEEELYEILFKNIQASFYVDKKEQLEKLGVIFLKVKDENNRESYVSSLNGKVKYSFNKNGTHKFNIDYKDTIITENFEINNIREKNTAKPYKVNIGFGSNNSFDSPILYSIDNSNTWNVLSNKIEIEANNSISFKYNKSIDGTDSISTITQVVFNNKYYTHFKDLEEWRVYFPNREFWLWMFAQSSVNEQYGIQLTNRQLILFISLTAGDILNINKINDINNIYTYNLYGYQLISDALTMTEEELNKKYPQRLYDEIEEISSNTIFNNNNIITTINVTEDTNLFFRVEYCLTTDTYVEVVVWDEKRRRKVRKKKRIKDITYDDELVVWDFDKGEFTTAKPLWIMKEKTTTKYNLLKFSDGSELKTINQHRIFNKEKGKFTYPMTEETPVGTTTFNVEGKEVKLVSKEIVEKEVEYTNIITEYHMNLFANNILTSCRFSNLYPIKDMKYEKEKRKKITREKYKNIPEEYYYGLRLEEQPIEVNRGNDVHHVDSIEEYIQEILIPNKKK